MNQTLSHLRKMPIGIQSFEKLRREGFVYVDKTELVYRLASTPTPYFLSRPRRFGKSLLLSTLEAYFLGKRELFEGLAVERLETEWATHAVLHLDLNAGQYQTVEELDKSLQDAESAIWKELERLKTVPVEETELEKVKNRYESEQIFNNLNYLNVATNLAYFELIGQAENINKEVEKYRAVTAGQIQKAARQTFVPENCSILYYLAEQ